MGVTGVFSWAHFGLSVLTALFVVLNLRLDSKGWKAVYVPRLHMEPPQIWPLITSYSANRESQTYFHLNVVGCNGVGKLLSPGSQGWAHVLLAVSFVSWK